MQLHFIATQILLQLFLLRRCLPCGFSRALEYCEVPLQETHNAMLSSAVTTPKQLMYQAGQLGQLHMWFVRRAKCNYTLAIPPPLFQHNVAKLA